MAQSRGRKTAKTVETLTHQNASRRNIIAAESQSRVNFTSNEGGRYDS